MSINTVIMAAAGVVTTVGAGWIANLDTASQSDIGYGIAVDGSGNVYVTGAANTSITSYIFIAKYDTNGVIQWQRKFVTATNDTGNGIAVDTTGNVYVTGQAGGTTTASYIFIAKYNTNGALQWQRSLDTNSQDDTGRGIAVDGSGNVYVTGQANGISTSSYIFIAKLPGNGNLFVGGGILSYFNSIMLEGPVNVPAGNSTLTDSAGTFTDSAGTLTDSAGTLPSITSSGGAGNLIDSAGTLADTSGTLANSVLSVATLIPTVYGYGIPDTAASMTDSASAMTSTTLTI